ncbi:MAG: hypothetical protein ABF651_06105 [Sporolactobacillus sp.]
MAFSGYFSIALNILSTSVLQICSLLGGLVFVGFLLNGLETGANRFLIQTFGMKGIYLTAWIGTPVHELGHALMCLIFRHRIVKIKWFQMRDAAGTIGYVSHSYNLNSFYQRAGNLFIGLAPLISGGLAIIGSAFVLLPPESRTLFPLFFNGGHVLSFLNPQSWALWLQTLNEMVRELFAPENFAHPLYWLFLWIALCIASHMSLSREDVRGAVSGIGAIFLLSFLASTLAALLDPSLGTAILRGIGKFNYALLLFLTVSLIFSFVHWIMAAALYGARRLVNR